MTLFLSYAHQDLDVVTALRRDLEDLGQSVWLDESLHGGQIWWDEILRQLRQCNGFILAVSALSLESEACLAEWQYAVDLARPFLPVRIDATEWTAAPDRMRQSQRIDYKPNDADSVKALVRSLGGFSQSVPLPEVLPPPPPTPLSYHERYAKLFAATPLTFDDQITYFARLTTDVDSANSKEALELLSVLRNREDLTVKMGKRIDEFLAQRDGPAVTGAGAVAVATAEPPHLDATESAEEVAGTDDVPAVRPNRRRQWMIAAGAAAVVLIGVVLAVVLWPESKKPAAPRVENTECDADNCSDPPIQFLDITGDPEVIKVTVTDPNQVTRDADPPTRYNDGLEWHWAPNYADPIGDYTVHFAGTDQGDVERNFTVKAVDDSFGAVQRAGRAIAQHQWDEAAAIDLRIKQDLETKGEDTLNAQYPTPGQLYWVPYDASGRDNDNGTTIVGAVVSYVDADDETTQTCQLWSVDTGNQTMRSDPLPRTGKPHSASYSGEPDSSKVSSFVNECPEFTTQS